MAGALRHRGPDEFGVYRDARAGLAHARLSIIDLATGQQPLANEDGDAAGSSSTARSSTTSSCATSSSRSGHRFRTRSDTEVIVHAYEAWGDERVRALQRPVRDRALGRARAARSSSRAIGSASARSTSAEHDGRVYFASEVKAIFAADPAIPRALRSASASTRRSRSGRVVAAAARCSAASSELAPGPRAASTTPATASRERALLASRASREPATTGFRGLARRRRPRRCARRSSEATRLRMLRADVPVGSYLSGGLDSSLVAALGAARASGERLRTFSLRFEDAEYDETDVPARDGRAPRQRAPRGRRLARATSPRSFPDVVAPRRAADPAHRAGAAVPALARWCATPASRSCSPARAPTRCSPATTCSARRKVRRFWARAAGLEAAAAPARAALSVPRALAGRAAGDGAAVLRPRPRSRRRSPASRTTPRWHAAARAQAALLAGAARARSRRRRPSRALLGDAARRASRAGRRSAQDQYLEIRTLLVGLPPRRRRATGC